MPPNDFPASSIKRDADERMLDYARRAAPFGYIPRYVPPGSGRLPEEVPQARTIPAFKKGGMVGKSKVIKSETY